MANRYWSNLSPASRWARSCAWWASSVLITLSLQIKRRQCTALLSPLWIPAGSIYAPSSRWCIHLPVTNRVGFRFDRFFKGNDRAGFYYPSGISCVSSSSTLITIFMLCPPSCITPDAPARGNQDLWKVPPADRNSPLPRIPDTEYSNREAAWKTDHDLPATDPVTSKLVNPIILIPAYLFNFSSELPARFVHPAAFDHTSGFSCSMIS